MTFKNQTDSVLTLTATNLSHGIWTVSPPGRIESDQIVHFSSESSGIGTGTEGTATYQHENLTATVHLHLGQSLRWEQQLRCIGLGPDLA